MPSSSFRVGLIRVSFLFLAPGVISMSTTCRDLCRATGEKEGKTASDGEFPINCGPYRDEQKHGAQECGTLCTSACTDTDCNLFGDVECPPMEEGLTEKEKSNLGWIIGSVVLAVVLILILGGVFWWMRQRRRQQQPQMLMMGVGGFYGTPQQQPGHSVYPPQEGVSLTPSQQLAYQNKLPEPEVKKAEEGTGGEPQERELKPKISRNEPK